MFVAVFIISSFFGFFDFLLAPLFLIFFLVIFLARFDMEFLFLFSPIDLGEFDSFAPFDFDIDCFLCDMDIG